MSPRRRDAVLIILSMCIGVCAATVMYAPEVPLVPTALLGVGLVGSLVGVLFNSGDQDSSGR